MLENFWDYIMADFVIEPFERLDEPLTPENDDTITVLFFLNVTVDD